MKRKFTLLLLTLYLLSTVLSLASCAGFENMLSTQAPSQTEWLTKGTEGVSTLAPTDAPSTDSVPTNATLDLMTFVPTQQPAEEKTEEMQSASPSEQPTDRNSSAFDDGIGTMPTVEPTDAPTEVPTDEPTEAPIKEAAYTFDGKYIYFGEYPQSLKEESVTVTETIDDRGYYLGSDGAYYAKVVATPCKTDYEFSNGTPLTEGATYYFKVEPIRWRILSTTESEAFLLCDSIIENQRFDDDYHKYLESEMRAFLNGAFYEKAFDEREKEFVLTATVDNSMASANHGCCASEDTEDKVFLLSYSEVTNSRYGFFTNKERQMTESDYSLARGVGKYRYGTSWFLRSPDFIFEECVSYVYGDGYAKSRTSVDNGWVGTVPALKIELVAALPELPDEPSEEPTMPPASEPTEMPTDPSCIPSGQAYVREGNYIWFGEYPQSLKEESVTVTDTTDDRGYYLGSDGAYYAKVVATSGASRYQFSNGTNIIEGVVYYFKVEPIRFRILAEDGGQAFLLCDSVLIDHVYDDYELEYDTSDIRDFLINDFYESAFNDLQKEFFANPLAYTDIEDKVFLASYRDVTNTAYGFFWDSGVDQARVMKVSDYSYVNACGSWWWLRSPYDCTFWNMAHHVNSRGEISYGFECERVASSMGVVPALVIDLTAAPTEKPPIDQPTEEPTDEPTDAPTETEPTEAPSASTPTETEPTDEPTEEPPIDQSTDEPTKPSIAPTEAPSASTPTETEPTDEPTVAPTEEPSASEPTVAPTEEPSASEPTVAPTEEPSVSEPTDASTDEPTDTPTVDISQYENPVLFHTPVLDGVLDDAYLQSYHFENPQYTEIIKGLVDEKGNPIVNAHSNRSHTYLLWDGDYIYVAIERFDDDLIQRSEAYLTYENEKGDLNPWYHDTAEVWYTFEQTYPTKTSDLCKVGYDAFGIGPAPFTAVSEGTYPYYFSQCEVAVTVTENAAPDDERGLVHKSVVEYKIPAKTRDGKSLTVEDFIFVAIEIDDLAYATDDELRAKGYDPKNFTPNEIASDISSGYTCTWTRARTVLPKEGDNGGYAKATLTEIRPDLD